MANEPYAEYLGEGYCDKVRQLLTADDKICTDGMINSDVCIGAMKRMLEPYLEGGNVAFIAADKVLVQSEKDFATFQQAALYILRELCPHYKQGKGTAVSRAEVPEELEEEADELMQKAFVA